MTPTQLLQHDDSGQPWPDAPSPLADDASAAVAASLAVRALRQARGERPVGFKIGFTNRSIWPRYGVYAPIWGTVWNTTLRYAGDAGVLRLARTCEPRIEPECVFGLRAAPPPDASAEQLFATIDWLAPGFEIVQSHRRGWRFTAAETMADNGLHARLLVGAPRPLRELARDADDLHAQLAAAQVELRRGDETVDRGRGALVLDSPLRALQHLLRELQRTPGAPALGAGDVVTTGTWTDAWPVAPGERWQAAFSAPLAPLAVEFVP